MCLNEKMKFIGMLIFWEMLFSNIFDRVDLAEIRVGLKDKRGIYTDRMNSISSNIAVNAAEEAKAAESAQCIAGYQAAHRVKQQLADKAMEAAKSAQAAAAVKSALIDEIIREKEAVKMVILELVNSKKRIEQAIESQLRALQEEKSALKVLVAAMQVAESTSSNADSTLRGIQDDLIYKERVLQSALHRTDVISREENYAKKDLATTMFAARKAVMAAAKAKENVMTV